MKSKREKKDKDKYKSKERGKSLIKNGDNKNRMENLMDNNMLEDNKEKKERIIKVFGLFEISEEDSLSNMADDN